MTEGGNGHDSGKPVLKPESGKEFQSLVSETRTHSFNRVAATKPLPNLLDLLGFDLGDEQEDELDDEGRLWSQAYLAMLQESLALRIALRLETPTHIFAVDCAVQWTWTDPVEYMFDPFMEFIRDDAASVVLTVVKTLIAETAASIRVLMNNDIALRKEQLVALIEQQLKSEQSASTSQSDETVP